MDSAQRRARPARVRRKSKTALARALGRWKETGSLHVSTRNHSLIALPDGGALAIGGMTVAKVQGGTVGRATNTCELYDPETGNWTAADSMHHEYGNSAVVMLESGKVLVSRFRPVVQISREQAARIVDRLAADGFFVRARSVDAVAKAVPTSDACTIRIAADASQPKQVFVAGFADKDEAVGQLRALHTVLEGEAFKAMAKMIAWLDLSADSESNSDAISRYWAEVNHHRDEGLFPPGTLHLLDSRGATVGPETEPTHGLARWVGDQRLWLAPPGYEIARIEYRLGDVAPPLVPAGAAPTAQIDFASLGNRHAELLSLFEIRVVDADGTWRELKLDPGIRAVKTHVHRTDRWQMKSALRPWSKPAAIPEAGVLYACVVPEGADLYVNGESKGRVGGGAGSGRIPPGSYEVEARWPDGRRRSVTAEVKRGECRVVLLNADIAVVSREVVAASGSLPYLFTDRSGRIWLLRDQATTALSKNGNEPIAAQSEVRQ